MNFSIFHRQQVYKKKDVFNEFKDMALPFVSKYNGRLTLRIRPTNDSIIEKPYEIHLV